MSLISPNIYYGVPELVTREIHTGCDEMSTKSAAALPKALEEGGPLLEISAFTLDPLKTRLATRTREAVLSVHVTTIPVKSASTVLG